MPTWSEYAIKKEKENTESARPGHSDAAAVL